MPLHSRHKLHNAALVRLGENIRMCIGLALEKAAANLSDPAGFPLPADSSSLERVSQRYLLSLGPQAREKAAAAALAQARSPERMLRLGAFHQVDLRSSVPVETQVAALRDRAVSLSEADVQSAGAALGDVPAQESVRPGATLRAEKLGKCGARLREFRVVKGTEWTEDEIFIGGIAIDDRARITMVPEFKLGDFDDGEAWQPGPGGARVLYTFDLDNTNPWPRIYQLVLTIREEDLGSLNEYLMDLTARIRQRLEESIREWLDSIAPYLAVLILSEFVSEVLDEVFGQIQQWFQDEIFAPALLSIVINSPKFRFPGGFSGGVETWDVRGFGAQYTMRTDWNLLTAQEALV